MKFFNIYTLIALFCSLSASTALAVDTCGSFTIKDNPFPCCTHTDKSKGNCTWWAWKKAMDQWKIAPVSKGNAGTWATNKSSKFSVSDKPRKDSIVEFSGHVAWVTSVYDKCIKTDKKGKCTATQQRIKGTEMNCPDQYQAYGAFDYPAASKKYIYKK